MRRRYRSHSCSAYCGSEGDWRETLEGETLVVTDMAVSAAIIALTLIVLTAIAKQLGVAL